MTGTRWMTANLRAIDPYGIVSNFAPQLFAPSSAFIKKSQSMFFSLEFLSSGHEILLPVLCLTDLKFV